MTFPGKLEMHLLIRFTLARIVKPNFPFKGRGRRHCKFEKAMSYYLVVTIGVPLSSTRLGWSVKRRSMQEGFLFVSKFVGSLIN